MALLGAIMVNNVAYERVVEIVLAEHFFHAVHGRIFAAITRLIDRGQVANPVTLARLFDADEALHEIGGAKYLARLAASAVTVINAKDYALTIRDLWLKRELIAAAQDVIDKAQRGGVDQDGPAIAAAHIEAVYQATDAGSGSRGGAVDAGASADAAIVLAEAAYKNRGRITGVPTGIKDLDALLGGLQRGQLVILAGRPSMGKSSIGISAGGATAESLRFDAEYRGKTSPAVLEFQLEMGHAEVSTRRLAAITGLSMMNIRDGEIAGDQFALLLEARNQLNRLPILIDDTPHLTLADIRGRARRVARQRGLGLIVVDHLGLVQASQDTRRQGETAIVSETTLGLKALAKELDVPVLALCQLNRDLERREDKRPMLADLRSSGSIEQDGDVVMFVYREEYYLSRDWPVARAGEKQETFEGRKNDHAELLEKAHGKAQIIVANHRNGPIKVIDCRFDAARAMFRNMDQGDLPL